MVYCLVSIELSHSHRGWSSQLKKKQRFGVSMKDVFISYSRKDLDFVQKIYDAFCQQNREVWFDQHNIPLTADWRKEMYLGIEEANSFVFIISPDSVTSKPCTEEIEHAILHNKRLLPVMYRKTPSSTVHPAVRSLNFIPFQEGCDFDSAFNKLIEAIDTDLDYVKAHTRIQQRAIEWDKKGRDISFLLRGSDRKEAEEWIEDSNRKEPKPTALQVQYIVASGQGEIQRQRVAIGAVGVGLVLCAGLAIVAFKERAEALRQRNIATEQGIKALTSLAQAKLLAENQLDALTASVKAAKQVSKINASEQLRDQVRGSLRDTVFKIQERNRLEGHSNNINSISFSPDGSLIASASDDQTLKLWRRDGSLITTLRHDQSVRSVKFSPDGQFLISASYDSTARIWNANGTLVRTLQHNNEAVRCASFSNDGTSIVTGTTQGTVYVWSLDGQLLRSFAAHDREINSITFNATDQLIATASTDKTVKLWTVDGELLQTLTGHRDRVWEASFSPDSQTLATAGADNRVILWKNRASLAARQAEIMDAYAVNTRLSDSINYSRYKTLEGHTNWVRALSFAPDGQTIASASYDQTIKLWNISGVLVRTFRSNNGGLKSIQFSPDGQTIASGSIDGAIVLRSLQGTLLEVLEGHRSGVKGVRFSPNGKLIASVGADDTVKLWSATGALRRNLDYTSGLTNVNFSPNGRMIATPSYDNQILLWRLDEALANPSAEPFQKLAGHTSTVNNISIAPNGKLLASASADSTLRIWDLEKGTLLETIQAHKPEVTDVTFTADSKRIVTVGSEGLLKLWSIDGTLLQSLQAHSSWINALMFDRDRQILVTGSGDTTARLWKLNAQGLFDTQPYKVLRGHQDWVFDVAFSPSNQMIATGGKDNRVILWNLEGKQLTQLDEHRDWVLALTFSPDGQKLASASADKRVILWTLDSIRQLAANDRSSDLNTLLSRSCKHLHDYLKTNPKVEEQDRVLCDEKSR